MLGLLFAPVLSADNAAPQAQQRHPPPPVHSRVETLPATTGTFHYEQQPLAGRASLVNPDEARAVVESFRETYAQLGKPRMLIYVNRELIREDSGRKLVGRTERYETKRTTRTVDFKPAAGGAESGSASVAPAAAPMIAATGDVTLSSGSAGIPAGSGTDATEVERLSGENTYTFSEAPRQSLADRQTTRDVERLFGRPLRLAGASLADQRIGAQLLEASPSAIRPGAAADTTSEQDRQALLKHADVVLEILIGSRQVRTAGFSGDVMTTVPDIQATAVRLSDSQILGQASSVDVLGGDAEASRLAGKHSVQEIAEATALALMRDLMLRAEP